MLTTKHTHSRNKTYVCFHGHFYQPERVNPFTDMIPLEETATPFSNYNEKITAECYRPNAEAGNFDLISFDVGPTLLRWLAQAHPDVYARIIAADRHHLQQYGVGNAMAQPYHHSILPVLSACDKWTQIQWGLADFCFRFGHAAQGMWLPETAVDLETLDLLAQAGITYTVLAPWQAATPVDITEPYRVQLSEGRSITVFFYNDFSGPISYNDAETADANRFAEAIRGYINHGKEAAGEEQLITVATDGELYGHHKAGKDEFLTYFLRWCAPGRGLEPCSLGRYLTLHPATREVQIHEQSSWSCKHGGVARWSTGCSCTEGDPAWKPALLHALIHLASSLDHLFETEGSRILENPWKARNDYLLVRLGWEPMDRFWARHARAGASSIADILRAKQLLEAQYWMQCARTSCGWFFEDPSRIEPMNNLAFARRAISLMWETLQIDLQTEFLKDLEAVRSWRTGARGDAFYRALPPVPESLLPSMERVLV